MRVFLVLLMSVIGANTKTCPVGPFKLHDFGITPINSGAVRPYVILVCSATKQTRSLSQAKRPAARTP